MGQSKKRLLIVLVLLIVACGLATVLFFGISSLNEGIKRTQCMSNMSLLGNGLRTYARNHDKKYPPSDIWCDELTQGVFKGNIRSFVCKPDGQARSHYAINPNAAPDSPSDVVLLFETIGGWNQSGGLLLLTTDNHKGKGCNVLFVSGNVRFVRSEDIANLRWKGD